MPESMHWKTTHAHPQQQKTTSDDQRAARAVATGYIDVSSEDEVGDNQ